MTNRFNRDYALVRDNGQVLAESHSADRLHSLRYELASEGVISSVVKSDLPRIADDYDIYAEERAERRFGC